jgi:hypothetical protein
MAPRARSPTSPSSWPPGGRSQGRVGAAHGGTERNEAKPGQRTGRTEAEAEHRTGRIEPENWVETGPSRTPQSLAAGGQASTVRTCASR